MPSITIPSKDIPKDFKNEVHKRVERLWLYGITRMLKRFAWNETVSKDLESLLAGRMAISSHHIHDSRNGTILVEAP